MTLPSLLGAWRLCDQKKELERKAVSVRDALFAAKKSGMFMGMVSWGEGSCEKAQADVDHAKAEHDRAIELLLMELKSWMQEP